jgi:hypothetical protein
MNVNLQVLGNLRFEVVDQFFCARLFPIDDLENAISRINMGLKRSISLSPQSQYSNNYCSPQDNDIVLLILLQFIPPVSDILSNLNLHLITHYNQPRMSKE